MPTSVPPPQDSLAELQNRLRLALEAGHAGTDDRERADGQAREAMGENAGSCPSDAPLTRLRGPAA
jgi:hypothetical protein